MDLFPEAAKVREAQKELDEIIQQGVFQITRLLKNTEAGQESDIPSYSMRRVTHVREPRVPASSRGRLTERLLAQGLLTPGMLSELRKEWDAQQVGQSQASSGSKDSQDYGSDSDDDDNKAGKKTRRKRKK